MIQQAYGECDPSTASPGSWTHSNIFVVNSYRRPLTWFVVIQRLSTVFEPLPPCACCKYEMQLHRRMLAVLYNTFLQKIFSILKSNTKLYCASLFRVTSSSYDVASTTAECNSRLERPNVLKLCTHIR